MKKNLSVFLAVAFLLLVMSILFYDVVFSGKTFKVSTMYAQALPYGPYGQEKNASDFRASVFCDTAPFEEPFFQFLKTNFQKGIFPLWNPHQLCGTPMSLVMEGGIFFPLNIAFYVLPNTVSLDVVVLLRILIAGLLMYWLMSVWGFGYLPRITAALIFMFTGPMVVGQIWTVNADMLLPLLFLVSYKVFEKPSLRHCSFFSLAIGLSVLSGHVEHIFLTHFLMALYILFLFWQDVKKKNPDKVKKILALLGFYILGIGISAVVLFPFIDDFFRAWTNHTGSTGLASEHKVKILTMLVPGFFSKGFSSDGVRYTWVGGYLGVIAVLLSILGFWLKERKSLVWFLGGVAIFVFGIMFSFSYARWIGHLPIFNVMLLTWHLSHIFAFLIALLAAFGCQELLSNPLKSFQKVSVIAIVLASYITGHLWIYREQWFFGQALAVSRFSLFLLFFACVVLFVLKIKQKKQAGIIAAISLIVLMLIELFILNPRYRVKRFDSFPTVPYIEFLKNKQKEFYSRSEGKLLAFYKNTAMAYGLDSFGGHQSLYPDRYVQFVDKLIDPEIYKKIGEEQIGEVDEEDFNSSDFLGFSNVKYIVLGQKIHPGGYVYNEEVQIMPLHVTVPRAYLTYAWDFEKKGQERILDSIKESAMKAVFRVIIERDSQDILPEVNVFGKRIIVPVKIEKTWANGVTLKANAEKCSVEEGHLVCVFSLSSRSSPTIAPTSTGEGK